MGMSGFQRGRWAAEEDNRMEIKFGWNEMETNKGGWRESSENCGGEGHM